nr:ribonuclease H-like domain-containing protein [Tanacetum cinerariifolium]
MLKIIIIQLRSTGFIDKERVNHFISEASASYTDEVIHSFFVNKSSAPQLDYDDLEHINDDDMEEMDLKWQVAMISMRINKFHKRTGRKLQSNTKDPVGFDKTKVDCFKFHKIGHFARDCRAKGNQDSIRRDVGYNGKKSRDNGIRPAYQDDPKALVTIDREDVDWSGHVEEDTQNYAMMAYSSNNSSSDNKTSVDELDAKPSESASCKSDSNVETPTSMSEPVENSDDDSVSNVQEEKEKPSFDFIDTAKHVKTSMENVKETCTPNHGPNIEKQDRNVHTRKGLDQQHYHQCGSLAPG